LTGTAAVEHGLRNAATFVSLSIFNETIVAYMARLMCNGAMDQGSASFGELSRLVSNEFEGLSPQLQKAVRFLMDHPDDVALRSMRQVAQEAKIPAATFVRLARALGYKEYNELRLLFQGRMRDRRSGHGTGYIPKARSLQQRSGGDGAKDLVRDLFASELANIEDAYQLNSRDAFVKAAQLIESSRRVFILGQRSCYSIAFLFNYVYRLAHSNSVLLHNEGGVLADEMRDIGRGDLLISISLAPYTLDVVDATALACEQGSNVLAITDERLSPIGRIATEVLLGSAGTPSFFHSITSLVTIAQTLLALLVARGGKKAMSAIERSEKQVRRFNPYWSEKKKRRSLS
jgi:DNA-binding MurR/RpiR family transcriptional regulator